MNTTDNTQNSSEEASQYVTLKVTGKMVLTKSAKVSATLRAALKEAGKTNFNEFSYQDEKGKVVSLDRKLTKDIKIHAIAKTSGG